MIINTENKVVKYKIRSITLAVFKKIVKTRLINSEIFYKPKVWKGRRVVFF